MSWPPSDSAGERRAPYLIAEMACAHEGEAARAFRLVDSAVAAGFDAVQLQIFRRAFQVPPQHRLYPLLGRLELSDDAWESVFARARQYEIDVFVFAYDLPSMELALEIGADGIKLSSADLSNPEMLVRAADSGLPVTLGTGASTLDEIGAALEHMEPAVRARRVVLMHGMQNFPTNLEDAQVSRIALLRRVFELPVGYQDHTDAERPISRSIDLLALGFGACALEKHLTLDRSEKGTDYQAALEPDEAIAYVRLVREAAVAAGPYGLRSFSESDHQYRIFQKKRLVASVPIPRGARITREQLAFLRSEQPAGFSPIQVGEVVGKAAARDIEPFTLIDAGALVDA
jgi:sialic acid synthase SpsE